MHSQLFHHHMWKELYLPCTFVKNQLNVKYRSISGLYSVLLISLCILIQIPDFLDAVILYWKQFTVFIIVSKILETGNSSPIKRWSLFLHLLNLCEPVTALTNIILQKCFPVTSEMKPEEVLFLHWCLENLTLE